MKLKFLFAYLLCITMLACLSGQGFTQQNITPDSTDITAQAAIQKAMKFIHAFGLREPVTQPYKVRLKRSEFGERRWRIDFPEYQIEISSPQGMLKYFDNIERKEELRSGLKHKVVRAINTENKAKAILTKYAKAGGVPQDRLFLRFFKMFEENNSGQDVPQKTNEIRGIFARNAQGGYPLANYNEGTRIYIDPFQGVLLYFSQTIFVEYVPSPVNVTKEQALQIAKASPNYAQFLKQGKLNIERLKSSPSRLNPNLLEKVEVSLKYAILDSFGIQRNPATKPPIKANLVWVVAYGGCTIYIDPDSGKELEVYFLKFRSGVR